MMFFLKNSFCWVKGSMPERSAKQIDLSTVFSTFDKDQLANIHRHYWKEHLKISKPAKFESDMSPTIQTSVKFCDFAELYLRSLLTNHFQTWQV